MTHDPVDPAIEARWRERLTEGHRPLRFVRSVFRHLPTEPRCKLCSNPFGGLGGKLIAPLGYRPSRKNPNLCRQCCDTLPPGGAEIDIAVLFADLRGSTSLGERMHPGEYAGVLNRFYRAATGALLRHDAIIDKLIGDEVMALFIPGICGPQYRRRALDAAIDLRSAVHDLAGGETALPVGIGVHAGTAYVGNVGADTLVDFTALGDAVNIASRLQAFARPGEIVFTDAMYPDVRDGFPTTERREVTIRGKEDPVPVHALAPPARPPAFRRERDP